MSDRESTFLVNAYSDPVLIKIEGRANFMNSSPISTFIDQMIDQGRRHLVVDFANCAGMDSTFLGILAGAGIKLMHTEPVGTMVLARLSPRNLELVKNLGLDRIMKVDSAGDKSMDSDAGASALDGGERKLSEVENARLVLAAHENLVAIDASNETKFQDVIAFLRNQVDG